MIDDLEVEVDWFTLLVNVSIPSAIPNSVISVQKHRNYLDRYCEKKGRTVEQLKSSLNKDRRDLKDF